MSVTIELYRNSNYNTNVAQVPVITIASQPIRIIIKRIGKSYDHKQKLIFKKSNQCNTKVKKCKPHVSRTKY